MDRPLEPALVTAGLWLLFGGSHIALASHRLRSPLVARFGRNGFTSRGRLSVSSTGFQ